MSDLDAGRLEVAKQLGADHTLQVKTRDGRQLAQQIVETLGCQPDHTIECSGAPASIATAIHVSNCCLLQHVYMPQV